MQLIEQAAVLPVAEMSGLLFIVCCTIDAFSGALIGWCHLFGRLALPASGGLARCSGSTGCSWLALGFLTVADIFWIIRCIAAWSADCAIGGTDRVLVTLRLKNVSDANDSEKRPTYHWKRRSLVLSTGIGSDLIACNGTG